MNEFDRENEVDLEKNQHQHTYENKNKKKVSKYLYMFLYIAWFTFPIWLPSLLGYIFDNLDGALKTFLLVAILVPFILILIAMPTRYSRNLSLKERFFNFFLYIVFILIGIILFL